MIRKILKAPVAILGAGVSGKAVAQFCEEQGVAGTIFDASGTPFDSAVAPQFATVVFSPAFPPNHPWLEIARAAGCECLTEIDFAAQFLRERELICVTGTNGKTTLTEFLAFALNRLGKNAVAVGNNGVPLTTQILKNCVPAEIIVCETSSFQAEPLEKMSPNAVLWTNIDEDHLERHGSLETYFRAKFHLIERAPTNAICIIGESVPALAKKLKIEFPPQTQIATRESVKNCVPAGTIFETFPQMENYALALAFWRSRGFLESDLIAAAQAFKPRAHRLAKVASCGNVEFWDDSKGTNFHAVYAALKSFPDATIFWIGGGLGKGGDLKHFAETLAGTIAQAFLIGKTAPEMQNHFAGTAVNSQVFESLQAATTAAFAASKCVPAKRAVILFSPGFASFDMFKSYADRGNQFVACVQQLLN